MSRSVIAWLLPAFVSIVSLLGGSFSALPTASSEVATGPRVHGGPFTFDDELAEVARSVPEFAGIVDDEVGGRRLVLLTKPKPELATRAHELLVKQGRVTTNSALRVTAMPAEYGFLQLKDWYDAIASTVLALPDVVLTDIDEANNRLLVAVSDIRYEEAVRKVVGQRFVPQQVVRVERMEPIRQHSLRSTHRPLLGGLEIGLQSSIPGLQNTCSLGFIAERGGRSGFVTNSHCTRRQGFTDNDLVGQPVLASDTVVGVEGFDPFMFTSANDGNCPAGRRCRYSDAAWISTLAQVTVARGWVARPADGSPDWDHSSHYTIDRKGEAVTGSTVEKIGRTTGLTRGPVQTTCARVRALNPDGSDTGNTLLCQWIAAYLSQPGDSGSTVVALEAGNNRTLRGLSWGGNGAIAAYSTIGAIEFTPEELGPLTVCAVPNC